MPASSTVFGSRSLTSCATDSFMWYEKPRSPCRTESSQRQYCTGRGLSRPCSLLNCSIDVLVAMGPSTARAVPPGSSWSSRKTITVTSSRTTTA